MSAHRDRVRVRGAGEGPGARERRARTSSTWRSASPISRRRSTSSRPGKRALDEGWTEVRADAGLSGVPRGHRRATSRGRAASQSDRRERRASCPAASRSCSSRMMALLEPGDEVIYPDPGFPIYESMINFLGATPVADAAGREPRLLVRSRHASAQRLSTKTKLVILNSPANPTGGVIPRDDLERDGRACCATATCIVLSDEIYSRICYERRAVVRSRSSTACSRRRSSSTASRRPTR